MKVQVNIISVIFLSIQVLIGCGTDGPAEIHYGQDQCDYCNMNIVDKSFGSQLVTEKGKVFKFDSIECLAAFECTSESEMIQNSLLWVSDFENAGTFVKTDSAVIVFNEQHKSPMGVGLLGFSTRIDSDNYIGENGGLVMSWQGICDLVKTKWDL